MAYSNNTPRILLFTKSNATGDPPMTDPAAEDFIANATDTARETMYRVFAVRFVPYSMFATVCICFNILSILAMRFRRGYKTVHHLLLYNLAFCDLLGSGLLWMYYNSPYLFPHFEINTAKHCLFIVLALVAPFILSLTSSMLSILLLALNQYVAICNPLFSTANITKGKAFLAITCLWILSLTLSMSPGILMLFMTKLNAQHCRNYVQILGLKAIEICSYGLACMILVIVALYARIYRIIVTYRKRASGIIRRNRVSDTESNYKAFMTTLLLTGALVAFWLPFVAFHFLSHVIDISTLPDQVIFVKLYFIDFLPMFIFITDPVIYGIRMIEIRKGYRRLFNRILPWCVKMPERKTVVRSSVRFTTIEVTSSM